MRPCPRTLYPDCLSVNDRYFLRLRKRWRPFDVAFEERLPSKVEPIGYGLNALRVDRLPVRESCPCEASPDVPATLDLGNPFP